MRIPATLCTVMLLGAHGLAGRAADADVVTLRVKPVLCIADRIAASCSTSFHVSWQSTILGDYCLATDLQPLPLRCWTHAQLGELREQRVVREDFSYRMSDPSQAHTYAAIKVEVLRIDTGDRRRERRSRHVWDVL
jgi:hypothetical protein